MANKFVYSAVAIVGIAAASAGAWWYQSRPQGPQEMTASPASGPVPGAALPAAAGSAPRPAGVEVAQVTRTSLQDDALSVGSLRSRQSVMMRPEVPGRVKALGFTDGGTVKRGQVMVQLDDTLQRAEIKQAKAQVSIAEANYKRNQELVAQNFVAQRVLEESSASLQVAEAQLALACARLSRMAIVAPFDGTVGIRNVNLGDFVKDGADLINLEDTSSMYVDFRLPERFQSKLRLRQTVEMQLDAMPGRLFKATVEAIDPLFDANGRSIGVRAVLPNTPGEPLVQGGRPGGAAGAAGPAATGKPASPPRPAAAANRPARPPAAAASAARTPAVAAPARVDADGCPVTAEAAAAAGAGRPAATPAARPQPAAAAGQAARPQGNPTPLRPGMFARVTTVFAVRDKALTVPEEAIVPQGGRQFVVKVVEPSALPPGPNRPAVPSDAKLVSLRQEVKLGVRQQGKVEITEGLLEGETVVVAGQQRLQRDGSPLRIVEIGRTVPGLGVPGGAANPSSAPATTPVAAASR